MFTPVNSLTVVYKMLIEIAVCDSLPCYFFGTGLLLVWLSAEKRVVNETKHDLRQKAGIEIEMVVTGLPFFH